MSFLELRKVSKRYGEGDAEVLAVREVDLSVEAGELVAVMGPSGSGKSSLLSIAGTLEDPTSGEVIVGGAPVSTMSRNEKARLRRRTIGYVFQDFNLLAGLTAAENVSLPLELDGTPAKKARVAAMTALEPASTWPNGHRTTRTSFRVANVNEWPSPGPSLVTVACCSPTSPLGPWTRSTVTPSCA